ncbi:low-density lipoprotein receptor-related protein 1B [Thrips palmi]|uniref:Low-density lipoprotein receptor-related protein 1B n=1 Tax=Thrips palmi TaxID=161013 RepID=A0A6P8ZAV0_THRPL|nr:low-density lipoprotein receptor-related protein 1B [Thrips palmi]
MRAHCLVALVAVLAVLGTTSVDALTAFGKSNSQDNKDKTPTAKVPKGRLCNSGADCEGTASTTCMLDKADGKKHCLCRDGTAPVNSKCTSQPVLPGKPCSSSQDCILNAECITPNDTSRKQCTCKEGYEYQPSIDDSLCSGCAAALPWLVTLLLTLFVLVSTDRRSCS